MLTQAAHSCSLHQVGVGIVKYTPAPRDTEGPGQYQILTNPRKTYVTPPGTGFLPRETSVHHQKVLMYIALQHCLSSAYMLTC
jgi:N6-L-threonylcarbamoyladenine synthase